ncbi:MAG TPA: hypothetical protein VFA90_14775 [Terriglobales bacterium]|nr:hypothetical protein [Terriglobales bacterium]
MVRRATPPSKPADWPHEKTLAVLKRQLASLDTMRGKNYQEAENEEDEWQNLTLNVLTHGFGEDSNNVRGFYSARSSGEYYMSPYGMAPGHIQSNFIKRIDAFTSLLKSSIAELQLMLPEQEITGAYGAGDDYAFYRDLKIIIGFAQRELFVIDNYLDSQLFDVYMENLSSSVRVRVLTRGVVPSLKAVADKFAKRGDFELGASNGVHDRVVFPDDRCFVIGSSIKDAAVKRPTYIVEHSATGMRDIYEKEWQNAALIIRS